MTISHISHVDANSGEPALDAWLRQRALKGAKVILNDEFYGTEQGKCVSSIIRETSERLIRREYNLIPCDNMREPIELRWRDAMNEMLDHYFAKLLPWQPGHPSTRLVAENEKLYIVEAWLRHDDNGVIEDGAIVMSFDFYKDGKVNFERIRY